VGRPRPLPYPRSGRETRPAKYVRVPTGTPLGGRAFEYLAKKKHQTSSKSLLSRSSLKIISQQHHQSRENLHHHLQERDQFEQEISTKSTTSTYDETASTTNSQSIVKTTGEEGCVPRSFEVEMNLEATSEPYLEMPTYIREEGGYDRTATEALAAEKCCEPQTGRPNIPMGDPEHSEKRRAQVKSSSDRDRDGLDGKQGVIPIHTDWPDETNWKSAAGVCSKLKTQEKEEGAAGPSEVFAPIDEMVSVKKRMEIEGEEELRILRGSSVNTRISPGKEVAKEGFGTATRQNIAIAEHVKHTPNATNDQRNLGIFPTDTSAIDSMSTDMLKQSLIESYKRLDALSSERNRMETELKRLQPMTGLVDSLEAENHLLRSKLQAAEAKLDGDRTATGPTHLNGRFST